MPTRPPPFILNSGHEVRPCPELEVDWTQHENREVENALRHARNLIIKGELLAGRSVIYRSSGWSLYPRISSNDAITLTPVTCEEQIRCNSGPDKTDGDIVFCEVQPNDRFYAHLVKEKYWSEEYGSGRYVYTISNLSGRPNGWCYFQHIYGKVTQVRDDERD